MSYGPHSRMFAKVDFFRDSGLGDLTGKVDFLRYWSEISMTDLDMLKAFMRQVFLSISFMVVEICCNDARWWGFGIDSHTARKSRWENGKLLRSGMVSHDKILHFWHMRGLFICRPILVLGMKLHEVFIPLPPSDAVRKQKKYFRWSFQFSIVTI